MGKHALVRAMLLVLAVAALSAGLAAVNNARDAVHLGLILEANSGKVLIVESGSAAANAGLRAGDVVTAIGGLPSGGNPTVISGLLPVSIKQGNMLGVRWLAMPASGRFWPGALLLVVAAIFWIAGVLVALLGPRAAAGYWFALFAFLLAAALAGVVALEPPAGLARWLPAPTALGAMVAYIWLQRALAGSSIRLHEERRNLLLSAQALLVAAAVVVGPMLLGSGSGPGLAALAGLDLLVLLVAAHLPAPRPAAGDRPAPVRRRLRLALLIGIVGWLPALVLAWAPLLAALLDHGYGSPLSPYIGAVSLLVPAITYPAIVARADLFALEAVVRRLAASLVAAGVLLAVALGLLQAIDRVASPQGSDRLAIAVVLLLLTVPAFDPFRRRLQQMLEHRLDAHEPGYSGSLEAIGDRLLQALDEPGIAEVLTSYAPPILGVSSIAVWLQGSDGRWLYFAPGANGAPILPPNVEGAPLVLLGAGTALEQVPPQPPALLRTDQPFAPPPGSAAPGTALYVPVCIGEDPRGLLVLGPRRSQDPYRRAERDALVLLSRQVAAALLFVDQIAALRSRNADLAQLTSRLARAREEERKHLSHELHDEVAQDLVAITRQLRRHQSGAVSQEIWQDMIAQAQEALTAIRRICNDLRPAILDMGLASALRELVDRASSGPQPLRVQLEIHGVELRLEEEREFALYRISQEALANVTKHAGATEVTIAVRYSAETAEVEVTDNGRGFAVPERLEDIGGDHLGLLGMRERLADLGGQVRVESRPGLGTRVYAQVPAVV